MRPLPRSTVQHSLRSGKHRVFFTAHAHREMTKDGITLVEAEMVLRTGTVREPEWENGAWRYQIDRFDVTLVIELEPSLTVVVTAWRRRR